MEVGERNIIYLSIHCYHQNDSCINMGNDKSHFNVFSRKWWTKSQDSVDKPQPFWRERRAEAVLNRGPFTYQPNALPPGQTGSQFRLTRRTTWCTLSRTAATRSRNKYNGFVLVWTYLHPPPSPHQPHPHLSLFTQRFKDVLGSKTPERCCWSFVSERLLSNDVMGYYNMWPTSCLVSLDRSCLSWGWKGGKDTTKLFKDLKCKQVEESKRACKKEKKKRQTERKRKERKKRGFVTSHLLLAKWTCSSAIHFPPQLYELIAYKL